MDETVEAKFNISEQALCNLCVKDPSKVWALMLYNAIKRKHICEVSQDDIRKLIDIQSWMIVIGVC